VINGSCASSICQQLLKEYKNIDELDECQLSGMIATIAALVDNTQLYRNSRQVFNRQKFKGGVSE